MLNCGAHRCQQVCHRGQCQPCPRSPSLVKTCPCSQTPLTKLLELGYSDRKSCSDPIPSCGKTCNKPLACGSDGKEEGTKYFLTKSLTLDFDNFLKVDLSQWFKTCQGNIEVQCINIDNYLFYNTNKKTHNFTFGIFPTGINKVILTLILVLKHSSVFVSESISISHGILCDLHGVCESPAYFVVNFTF